MGVESLTMLVSMIATLAVQYVYPPYVPRHTINQPGEIFDIGVCSDAAKVSTDRSVRGCDYDEGQRTVWVEDVDNEGRARITINGDTRWTVSQRVLINCKGTATTLRSFWIEGRGYDFRGCQ